MESNLLIQNLSSAEKERLHPFLQSVSLEQSQGLIMQGEANAGLWFPDIGVTSTLAAGQEGNTIEVGLMGGEGMVGLSLLFGIERSNTTVVCQVPGRAKGCPPNPSRKKSSNDKGGPVQDADEIQLRIYGNDRSVCNLQ